MLATSFFCLRSLMPRRRRFRWNLPFLSAIAVFVLAIAIYIGLGVAWTAMAPKRMGVPHDLKLALIARALDATIAVWFFAVGASIGSFLNVVAYRLPLGKSLGGHSACPFCCTPIAPADNIPVFAWLRLRGRCRTCHLPISIQYPLVELAVGLIFLAVYFTEFSVGGSNLPGAATAPSGIGLVWTSVTSRLAVRVLLLVIVLSGLIAAALMVARRSQPPLVLFAWLMLAVAVGETALPSSVIVPWWPTQVSSLPRSALLQSVLKLTLGLGAGLLVASLTQPFLERLYTGSAWYGVVGCLGILLGWQAVASAACCVLLVSLLVSAAVRRVIGRVDRRAVEEGQAVEEGRDDQPPSWLGNPVVWSWLGLLLFRANWKAIDALFRGPEPSSLWMMVGLSALAAVPLAWLVGRPWVNTTPP